MTKDQINQGILDLYRTERENYILIASQTALRIASERGRVSADNLHESCPPPESIDSRIIGTILKNLKQLRPLYYEKSKRAECHHRPITIFGLKYTPANELFREVERPTMAKETPSNLEPRQIHLPPMRGD